MHVQSAKQEIESALNLGAPQKVTVIFRKWRDTKEILAIFPYEAGTGETGSCMSYVHVGQHGSADYGHCMTLTKPAAPEEYAELQKELEGLGYELKLAKRANLDLIGKNL